MLTPDRMDTVNEVIPVNTVQNPTHPPQAAGKNLRTVPDFFILPLLLAWIGTKRGQANFQCFGDPPRLEKRLDIRVRDAKCKRRTAPCTELHGRYRRPKQLARYAKNPGETRGVESGE